MLRAFRHHFLDTHLGGSKTEKHVKTRVKKFAGPTRGQGVEESFHPDKENPGPRPLPEKCFNLATTWPQHGSNLGPTWLHNSKTCQSRAWSPTCQPIPPIDPPRPLQGRIVVDFGSMLDRFSVDVFINFLTDFLVLRSLVT